MVKRTTGDEVRSIGVKGQNDEMRFKIIAYNAARIASTAHSLLKGFLQSPSGVAIFIAGVSAAGAAYSTPETSVDGPMIAEGTILYGSVALIVGITLIAGGVNQIWSPTIDYPAGER